jgi:tripartite-type tricarboxylate transporter receptor subunit TctC
MGTRPHWITEKKVTLLAQFVLERKRQIPDIPTLIELATADKKDVVEFLTAGTPFGRAMVVGPGVPADRVAALRKAFDDTMKDPAFLADAQKRSLDIDPHNWQHTHALVQKITSASPQLVERVKRSIGADE